MSLSVVIPCRNAAPWIRKTLSSVFRQQTPAASVIVVNDGSDDDSVSIVEEFGASLTLINLSGEGACKARNVGLERTSSPLVMFLDADDYLEGNFFGGAIEAFAKSEADVGFAPVYHERPDGSRRRIFHYDPLPSSLEVFGGWLSGFSQPPCSVVWRTEFVRSIGGWNEQVLKNQDGEISMRAMLSNPRLVSFSTGAGVYREHGEDSVSRNRSLEALQSELAAMRCLIKSARGTPYEVGVGGFGVKLYILARAFFEIEEWDLGREALSEARGVGLRGHPGTLAHRCVSSVFGLEAKTVLTRMLA